MQNTANRLETARTRVAQAQAELDAVLSDGQPSNDARATLALAEEELNRVLAAMAETAEQAATEHAAEIETQARAMVADAGGAIGGELATLAALPVPGVDLPVSTAVALLQARQKAAALGEASQAHRARMDALRGRLSALEAKRQAIIKRRSSGAHEPRDGEKLALLDADAEGLRDLIERVSAEDPSGGDATRDLSYREDQWGRTVADARRTALLTLAKELEAQLLHTAALLAATAPRGSTDGRWVPSQALRQVCSRGIA